MTSPAIAGLRAVARDLPERDDAVRFTQTWPLAEAARTADAVHLRGTGSAHHIRALHHGATPAALAGFLTDAHKRWATLTREIGALPEEIRSILYSTSRLRV